MDDTFKSSSIELGTKAVEEEPIWESVSIKTEFVDPTCEIEPEDFEYPVENLHYSNNTELGTKEVTGDPISYPVLIKTEFVDSNEQEDLHHSIDIKSNNTQFGAKEVGNESILNPVFVTTEFVDSNCKIEPPDLHHAIDIKEEECGTTQTMSASNKVREHIEMDSDALLQAIKMCLLENKGIRSTARHHGIDKSSLQRHVKKVKANFQNIASVDDVELLKFIETSRMKIPPNMVFSVTQENDLVKYVLKYVNYYYGLSIDELRRLAYQLAVKLNFDYPLAWDEDSKAGRKWYYLFIKRHPELTLRTPEQSSMNRVKAFCKENVDKFFENLARLLDEFHFEAASIYNMDESGFSTVPSKLGKVIALKEARRVGKVEAAERGTMVTMALTVSAAGNSIPPFFLFPRKKMQAVFLDNVSLGTVGFASDSGWMCQPEFVRYIHHFIKYIKPSVDSPVLLLLDNHTSYLSVDALDLAAANGILILSFPPHCSHKLQPLDVSVLGPTKAYYRSQCSVWQKNNANKVLEIRHIAGLVCATLDLALTPKTITSGFAASGIAPFNPDIFTDADFVQAVEQNAEAVAVDAGLNQDEQRRIFVNPINIKRQEDVLISEPSTSRSTTSMSGATSFVSILDEIGPLQAATPKTRSKRGRKAMESSELTFPESLAALKAKAAAKKEKLKKAAPPAKRSKTKTSPPSDEEDNLCIVCLKLLPNKLTAANTIRCNTCRRPVHLKCANMRASPK